MNAVNKLSGNIDFAKVTYKAGKWRQSNGYWDDDRTLSSLCGRPPEIRRTARMLLLGHLEHVSPNGCITSANRIPSKDAPMYINFISVIPEYLDVLLSACKDIGLAVNTGKTKYMEIGRHRGMMANAHIKIGSNSYEKLKTFKYLGSFLTNQNSVQEEIKCRLKAGNSCYYSVQTLLSSRLYSKNLKIVKHGLLH